LAYKNGPDARLGTRSLEHKRKKKRDLGSKLAERWTEGKPGGIAGCEKKPQVRGKKKRDQAQGRGPDQKKGGGERRETPRQSISFSGF